jgi:hypothetical protein
MLELPSPALRQCAWCLLVMDGAGQYSIQPGRKIRSATHGICPTCKDAVRADIDRKSLPGALVAA